MFGKYLTVLGPAREIPVQSFGGLTILTWDELRDVASGLFVSIIVTAKGKALTDGRPNDVDQEFVTMMVVINENESWFLEDNIKKFTSDPTHVKRNEFVSGGPDGVLSGLGTGFADTNLRYTVNGYMFGNMPMITMKKDSEYGGTS